MSLINHIEIIEQVESKLKPYLVTELKNSANWRENKSDDIKDQCNYFQSYFEKDFNSKCHINKEVLTKYLRESEKFTKANGTIPYSNFLDILINEEDSSNTFDLLFYDSISYKLKVITISNNNDSNQIELVDFNESTILTDTKAINMKVNRQYPQRINLIDMYSIYDITINNNKDEDIDNDAEEEDSKSKSITYTKQLTLPEIPNCFISNISIDKFFMISQGNKDNWLHLINDSYQIITKKILNDDNKDGFYLKGEYLGVGEHIAVFNKNTIKLCDFRSNAAIESILFSNDSFNINELKYIDNFNYITFSPQKLSLFDLRYPSLQISEMPLHINYSQFKMKEVIKSERSCSLSPSYSCIDDSKRDQSHLLFNIDEKRGRILNSFCKFDLIKNDKLQIDIHDGVSYINSNGIYLNFIVDNLCGVYLNVYDLAKNNNMKDDINMFNQGMFKEETQNDSIEYKTMNKDIIALFKKIFVNQVYTNQQENAFLKKKDYSGNEDINSDDNDDEDEEEEEEEEEGGIDLGSVMINGSKKKLYRIENKRDLLEGIINNSNINKKDNDKDIKIQDIHSNTNTSTNTNGVDIELNENDIDKLQFLIDGFDLSNQSQLKQKMS